MKRTKRFDSIESYVTAAAKDKDLIGLSPGGAAARMAVSRQRVHQMIDEGKLPAVYVYENGELRIIEIPVSAVDGWLKRKLDVAQERA